MTKSRKRPLVFICLVFVICDYCGSGIDVTFEGQEVRGYFLKPAPLDWEQSTEEEFNNGPEQNIDRFTLLNHAYTGGSATVKAEYGPFTARQTIPSGGLLDFTSTQANVNTSEENDSSSRNPFYGNYRRQTFHSYSDVSAHLVVRDLRRDSPVLKALFHTSSTVPNNRQSRSRQRESKFNSYHPCVTLLVHLLGTIKKMNATCTPTESSGTCLAEIVIPAVWWPPMDDRKTPKYLKRMVRVEYFAYARGPLQNVCQQPNVVPSKMHISDLPLSTSHGSYEEVRNDDFVSIMIPQTPIYPRSKVYVPVFLQPNPTYPIYVFVIRARVRSGLRILGAEVSQSNKWTINVDLNAKRTIATVTVFVNEATAPATNPIRSDATSHEVFSWLLEVDPDATYYDTGVITWNLRYVLDASMAEQYDFEDDNLKMTSRLDIKKDDIQAVLPISKSTELINTAVLNGRQVSRAMKVYIVSQAGEVSDVTLQSSCKSGDESVLKVSSSCTSVYLDGSEIRGSQNASVSVIYGTSNSGRIEFLVWMPELPLDIQVTDAKLGQIKNWKVSRDSKRRWPRSSKGFKSNRLKKSSNRSNPFRNSQTKKHKTAILNNMSSARRFDNFPKRDDKEKGGCRLRYQQTKIEVFAKFLAVDDSSGRESYLISRKTSLKITKLVEALLRVSDTRIASLNGKIVQGHQVGRTEIQVLSPITGRVIGAKEIRVGGDRVTITRLKVAVVSGLQLSVRPNSDPTKGYLAYTSVSHKLTAKYQEGLLDITVHFSDGTSTSLKDINEKNYHLTVNSLDSSVVAFAPMNGLNQPRVIAIGEGRGDFLHLSLELAKSCQKRRTQPLASMNTFINVAFNPGQRESDEGYQSGDDVQNDSYYNIKLKVARDKARVEKPVNDFGGTGYMKNIDEPSVQARQFPENGEGHIMTPLWIGIYALLGVFCLAIVVFTVSCMVFAVRYRKKNVPVVQAKALPDLPNSGERSEDGESIAHAHDWVWLGRATLERNSVNTRCSQTLLPMSDMNGNQTTSVHASAPSICHRPRCASSSSHQPSYRNSTSSEKNIHITENPHKDGKAPIMAPPIRLTRTPSQKAINVPSWVAAADAQSGRQNMLRIHQNPMHMKHKGVPLPAPIPPVRRLKNANTNGMSTFTIHGDTPPPVPPHAIIPKSEDKKKLDDSKNEDQKKQAAAECAEKHSEDISSVIEGDQPTPYAEDVEQDGEWDSVRMGMDYDQLMEYFDNLKESDA